KRLGRKQDESPIASCRSHLTGHLAPGARAPLSAERVMAPRYELAMASRREAGDPAGMKKRALAAVLWFYSTWYAGAMVAHMLGLSEALGPILGTAAAA